MRTGKGIYRHPAVHHQLARRIGSTPVATGGSQRHSYRHGSILSRNHGTPPIDLQGAHEVIRPKHCCAGFPLRHVPSTPPASAKKKKLQRVGFTTVTFAIKPRNGATFSLTSTSIDQIHRSSQTAPKPRPRAFDTPCCGYPLPFGAPSSGSHFRHPDLPRFKTPHDYFRLGFERENSPKKHPQKERVLLLEIRRTERRASA